MSRILLVLALCLQAKEEKFHMEWKIEGGLVSYSERMTVDDASVVIYPQSTNGKWRSIPYTMPADDLSSLKKMSVRLVKSAPKDTYGSFGGNDKRKTTVIIGTGEKTLSVVVFSSPETLPEELKEILLKLSEIRDAAKEAFRKSQENK